MRRLTLAGLVTAVALAAGCAGGRVYATATTPDLVAVGNGVYYVNGYDDVYYADNYYYRYYGDRWYRSPYYDRGWVTVSSPRVVARIEPYRTYRGGYVTRGAVTNRGTVHHAPRTVRRPVYRDNRYANRYDRRNDRRDDRDDRRYRR